jgi:hypothetical protein
MIINKDDVLNDIKQKPDKHFNIIYCDGPYNLGSEWIIKDGKFDLKKGSEFMEKWSALDGPMTETFFNESFRTLKDGGYLVMFGLDRQLGPLYYYATLAGFTPCQSLYWYFISNFPKASDASKNIDKVLGSERIKGEPKKGSSQNRKGNFAETYFERNKEDKRIITYNEKSQSTLGQKYEGYKYSIAPLKQVVETILVFQKPIKGSKVQHIIDAENDMTKHPGVIDVDGCRVPSKNMKEKEEDSSARFPAQTFISDEAAEIIDEQSGKIKATPNIGLDKYTDSNVGKTTGFKRGGETNYTDTGGASKILHHIKYEENEYDLYNYFPKVSTKERNAGCDGLKSVHPTMKPINLNKHILSLFKLPANHPDERIYIPFCGVFSEVIAAALVGYENIECCEMSEEYIEIGKARYNHWLKDVSEKKVKLKGTAFNQKEDNGSVYRLRKNWGGKLSPEEQLKADKQDQQKIDDFWE